MRTSSLLLVAALTVGCVSNKTHQATVAALASSEADASLLRERVTALGDEVDALREALNASEAVSEQTTALAAEYASRNAGLKARVVDMQNAIEDLAARSATDKAAKAEVEAMLAQVAADLEQTEAAAARTQAELAEMAAEAERLRAEKQALEAKTAEYDALVSSLEQEIAEGTVKVTELSGKLTVNLSNAILFESGKYALQDAGVAALRKVAGVLATVDGRDIRVEGHTDDVPVGKGAPYADNWALSSLRASAVVARLVEAGVAPDRIAAVGFADQHPIMPNDSAEHRAANRRTEIVLVPRLASFRGVNASMPDAN